VPITIERDDARRWLLSRATGELTITDITHFLRTARADIAVRMWPLLFDARGCGTAMTKADVPAAVAIVRTAIEQKQRRAHVALVADEDALYQWFLEYETQCAAIGVRIIRVFRELEEGRQWLEIVSAGRELASG
jgi:hypothetical protein